MKTKLETLLFKTFITLIPVLLLTLAWSWSVYALSGFITDKFTSPFLAAGAITTPPHRQLSTTKPLQVEYTVLKAPTVAKTGAKK